MDQGDPQTIAEMRAWVKDSADSFRDYEASGYDPDWVDGLTDEELLNGIDTHYCGGSAQFVQDAGLGS